MARNKQDFLEFPPSRELDTAHRRLCLSGSFSRSRGFTLLELMIVLTISAVLVTLAAPSFGRLFQSNNLSATVNTFLADMGYARSESIRRGGGVMLCRSDSPEVVSPVCSSVSAHTGTGWSTGWIVFQDMDNNGVKDDADPVLRVQAPIRSMDSIQEGGNGPPSTFRFTATGRLFDLASATALTFGGASYELATRRVVCISFGGRAVIAGDGSTDCGTDNL